MVFFVMHGSAGFEQGMVRGGAPYAQRKSWENQKVFPGGQRPTFE